MEQVIKYKYHKYHETCIEYNENLYGTKIIQFTMYTMSYSLYSTQTFWHHISKTSNYDHFSKWEHYAPSVVVVMHDLRLTQGHTVYKP